MQSEIILAYLSMHLVSAISAYWNQFKPEFKLNTIAPQLVLSFAVLKKHDNSSEEVYILEVQSKIQDSKIIISKTASAIIGGLRLDVIVYVCCHNLV